jgi:hypothetical protein
MHDFVQDTIGLLDVIAWPATVLIALAVLRNQIMTFLSKMTDAIGRAAQISIGKKGVEIKLDNKIDAVNSRISALKATQDQVKEIVYSEKRARRRRAGPGAASVSIPKDLRTLSEAYLAVDDPDWRQRVARKNELGLQMGNLVIREDVSRDQLAHSRDEGLYLALAAAVAADPEEGCLQRILQVAQAVSRLHVRYKIVLALIALINKGLVEQRDVAAVREALRKMSIRADEPLLKVIADAEKLLDAVSIGELRIDY